MNCLLPRSASGSGECRARSCCYTCRCACAQVYANHEGAGAYGSDPSTKVLRSSQCVRVRRPDNTVLRRHHGKKRKRGSNVTDAQLGQRSG